MYAHKMGLFTRASALLPFYFVICFIAMATIYLLR